MKRIPVAAALFTAFFLMICVFEARSRGIGSAPLPTDWELRQTWWQFDFLADCGFWILAPSFYVFLLTERFSEENAAFASAALYLSLLLTVLLASLAIFYITRAALHRPRA